MFCLVLFCFLGGFFNEQRTGCPDIVTIVCVSTEYDGPYPQSPMVCLYLGKKLVTSKLDVAKKRFVMSHHNEIFILTIETTYENSL